MAGLVGCRDTSSFTSKPRAFGTFCRCFMTAISSQGQITSRYHSFFQDVTMSPLRYLLPSEFPGLLGKKCCRLHASTADPTQSYTTSNVKDKGLALSFLTCVGRPCVISCSLLRQQFHPIKKKKKKASHYSKLFIHSLCKIHTWKPAQDQ